ncbi:unnamed protein product [Didymodactylos carnosus]|uniref:Uncharacterized protein n=1 Tax=Didymodactylos carnosus TaxID=1234261 RepID=A0A814J1Y4_9BILA|nr:unnamed protein product [Didymodactylos carnosus]CAF3802325.1 unnamed protein product [Didymodactylos carnosus]
MAEYVQAMEEICSRVRNFPISAMISSAGFHLPSVVIFECNEVHGMDSSRFVKWLWETSCTLRGENDETKLPKRAWKKAEVVQWLDDHKVPYLNLCTKAELLELAVAYAPEKKFKVDEEEFRVEILRLPIKHCVLNPIELAWAELKDFIRNKNNNFTLTDVTTLSQAYMAACSTELIARFIQHAQNYEETFKAADKIGEEMDKYIIQEDLEYDTIG